jgi:hypothetical protein
VHVDFPPVPPPPELVEDEDTLVLVDALWPPIPLVAPLAPPAPALE